MNASGVVDTARRLNFADDNLATAHGRDLAYSGGIEVWAGKRRVCVLPAAVDRHPPTETDQWQMTAARA